MIASAAYYIASACDTIEAATPNAETGSIGCVFAGYDDSDALDQMGVKRVRIYSSNATRKDSNIDTKTGRGELQLRADAQERNFIDRVAQGRGTDFQTVADDYGHGAVFVAEDPDPTKPGAISIGMIDGLSANVTAPVAAKTKTTVAAAVAVLDQKPKSRTPRSQATNQNQDTATAEGEIMNLAELLKANPEARAELDEKLKAAEETGRKSIQARIDAAKPFLAVIATEKGYDAAEAAQIAKAAIEVIAGAEDMGALKSFVRLVDMNVEKRKTTQAQTEQKPDTPPNHGGAEAAVMAQAVQMKNQATQNLLQVGLNELNTLDANTVAGIKTNLAGDQAATQAEANFAATFAKLIGAQQSGPAAAPAPAGG